MNNILIEANNIELTESMSESIKTKLIGDLENYESFIVEQVRVTVEAKLEQATDNFSVSIRVPVKGNDLFSSGIGECMQQALADATSGISRQFRKLKTKTMSQRHKENI